MTSDRMLNEIRRAAGSQANLELVRESLRRGIPLSRVEEDLDRAKVTASLARPVEKHSARKPTFLDSLLKRSPVVRHG